MEYELIEYGVSEGVATITLNRPRSYNALNEKILQEMSDALQHCRQDDGIRVVVLRGAGKHFCSGGDVKWMKEVLDGDRAGSIDRLVEVLHGTVNALRELEKPVLASIRGFATGAGFSLALACDLRIGSETARFSQAYVNIGLSPDGGSTYFLPRVVGTARAAELIFSGRVIDATEALALGILNEVVADGELDARTGELARKLAQAPTRALGMAKRLLDRSLSSTLEEQLERERAGVLSCCLTDDFAEGVRAFSEKRKPVFRGR